MNARQSVPSDRTLFATKPVSYPYFQDRANQRASQRVFGRERKAETNSHKSHVNCVHSAMFVCHCACPCACTRKGDEREAGGREERRDGTGRAFWRWEAAVRAAEYAQYASYDHRIPFHRNRRIPLVLSPLDLDDFWHRGTSLSGFRYVALAPVWMDGMG